MHGHRRALVVTLFVFAAIAVAIVVLKVTDGGDDSARASGPLSALVRHQTPAQAPFQGLGEVHVAVGDRCLRLAVADSLSERVAGLRDRTDLAPYDGMLFVFPGPSEAGFTMSGVTAPLDIGFYEADGRVRSHRRMAPCPDKVESQCPVYRADGPYQYAVETLEGQLPSGPLGPCPG
jgi:hypothetical protein